MYVVTTYYKTKSLVASVCSVRYKRKNYWQVCMRFLPLDRVIHEEELGITGVTIIC